MNSSHCVLGSDSSGVKATDSPLYHFLDCIGLRDTLTAAPKTQYTNSSRCPSGRTLGCLASLCTRAMFNDQTFWSWS